jgi:hypothetical protein
MNSPLLLSHYENCNREGFWARDFERRKIDLHELLEAGIREGLTSSREDFNEAAGERIIEIAARREIVSDQHDVYSQVIHHASIADIVCSAIRKAVEPPWCVPEDVQLGEGPIWSSASLLSPDGSHLRRVALVSNWGNDRHYSEARSWFSLGEVCIHNLPMQQIIIILGQSRDGKRHSHWTKGVLHPVSRKLRFRKKGDSSTGFKESWRQIWREDYDTISTKEWLQVMYDDGVLQDLCFNVDIPIPEKAARQKIVDLAARKLERLYNLKELPEQQLSTCDWPVSCIFRNPCHSGQSPNGKFGFVRVDEIG